MRFVRGDVRDHIVTPNRTGGVNRLANLTPRIASPANVTLMVG